MAGGYSSSAGGSAGSSTGQSTQQSTSTSVSTPNILQSEQSQLAYLLAQASAKYGDTVFNWAKNSLAPNTAVTDQAIGNYFDAAANQEAASKGMLGTYNNLYVPEESQLADLASQYGSTARQQFNAGQAIANSEQGSNAGLVDAQQQLQSFGVNPSSGVYQELAEAQKASAGAAGAAAGTTAATNTQQQGQNLLEQSIGVGQQLPGAAVNATNAASTANSGAVGAANANTTTGATALGAAEPYYATAVGLKYPGIGQTTSSTSQSSGQSTNQSANVSGNVSNSQPAGTGGGYGGYNPFGFSVARGGAIPEYNDGGGAPMPSPAMAPSNSAIPFDAAGGPIDGSAAVGGPSTGGFVSKALSPSAGRQTDDIPARLNAGEFVVPRDVTAWMGQQHFQKLIAKSRADIARATAKPQMRPA